ncbi:MAG: hypothetical protein ABIN57_02370 [Chitinophagaceae bacterium]
MNTTLFLLFSILLAIPQPNKIKTSGPDSWRIEHNGNLKLYASTENPAKNVITLKKADFKKAGALVIGYKEMSREGGWQRSITLFDEKDNELIKEEGALLKVKNAKLASLAASYKTIKIYTWALPTDPALAATVRIRRVHLCTILIK